VQSEEEVLGPVVERLGGEDAEFYEEARADGVFDEQIDLLLFSTPVECLGVRVREVSEDDGESGESDNQDLPHAALLEKSRSTTV
jgi:hypothetical protein